MDEPISNAHDFDTLKDHGTGDRPIHCIARATQKLESNPMAKSQLVASLFFTFWHLSETQFTGAPPWFLTINTSGPPDSLDEIIGPCFGRGDKDMGYDADVLSAEARKENIQTVQDSERWLAKLQFPMPPQENFHNAVVEKASTAITGGISGCGRYHRMYLRKRKGDFLIPGRGLGCLKARIDGSEDVLELKRHLLTNPNFLKLQPSSHQIPLRISGQISPEEWDRPLVEAAMKHASFLYLPYDMPDQPVSLKEIERISSHAYWFRGQCHTGLMPSPRMRRADPERFLGSLDWIKEVETRIWSRISWIPNHSHRAFILRVLHEIPSVARCLVPRLCAPETPAKDLGQYILDFQWCAMRALLISVESLVYHGMGFDPVIERNEMLRALDFIRENESVTKREILRRYPRFKKDVQDRLLETLEAQGLIHSNGRRVFPVSFSEFVESVGNNTRLGGRDLHFLKLTEGKKAASASGKPGAN